MNKKYSRKNEDRELLRASKRMEYDFVKSDPWRVLHIQSEFVEGFNLKK